MGVVKGPVPGQIVVCRNGHEYVTGRGCRRCKAQWQDEKRKKMRRALKAERAPKILPPPARTPDQPKWALAREQLEAERLASKERRAIVVDAAIERAKKHPEYVAKWVAKVKSRKPQ